MRCHINHPCLRLGTGIGTGERHGTAHRPPPGDSYAVGPSQRAAGPPGRRRRAPSAGLFPHPPRTPHTLVRPFAYFGCWRFIGFTLTPLTPRATPTDGHAPHFLQPPREHALSTRSRLSHWPRRRARRSPIGRVLPPAGACCEFCFPFFLFFSLPPFFPPPRVLHTQLREEAARSEAAEKRTRVQAAALATAVSLFCTGSDNKKEK